MSEPDKEPQREQICDALFAGRKIEAIKLYREMAGVGLKEAKDFVEALDVVLRKEQADKFAKPAAPAAGCAPLLVFLAGALALAAVWWLVR